MHEERRHARGRVPARLDEEVHRAAHRRPQPVAPRHPGAGPGPSRRHVPGRLPGVVRRGDPQRRLRRRRPQRSAGRRARPLRPDRGGRRRAGRPADRRHPRRRADPAGGLRTAGRAGLGLHRRVRHRQRRRVPHRAVPRRLQGDLGLPGRQGHLPPRAGRVVHRHRAPRTDGHRALGRVAGQVERARRRSHRHRPEPRAAAGAATAARLGDPGQPERRRVHPRRGRGRPHRARRARTAATRTSRTSPRARASSTRCS